MPAVAGCWQPCRDSATEPGASRGARLKSGRIDSVYEVPLPKVRHQDMKLEPEFIALKREILTRIRETSGVQTDLDQLARLSEGAVL